MDKKTLVIIGIVGIILVGMFMKKEASTTQYSPTLAECNANRQPLIAYPYKCVSECEYVGPLTSSCFANSEHISDLGSHVPIGSYMYVADDTRTCSEAYEAVTYPSSYFFKEIWDCFTIVEQPSCNTAADTDCNGCVTSSEFTTYKNLWKQIQVSNDLFVTAKNKWKTLDGC